MRAIRLVLAFTTATFLIAGIAARPVSAQEPGGVAGRSGQSEATLVSGTAILAGLNGSLDAKKAKVGDAVSAHTMEAVKSADGRTILPKATKLVGHLTQALARSKGDGESVLGIAFDKAVLKDGGEVALTVRVQAVAEPIVFSGGRASPSSDTSTLGTTQTSPMGNARMGPPGAQAPPAGVGDDTSEGANSGAELNARSRGVIGLRGLKLGSSQADNKMVATISSDGKNVRLDSGTRFMLVTVPNEAEVPTR